MIGYDTGARFDLDDVPTGPLGYVDTRYSKNFWNSLPADTLTHSISKIDMLPSSGNSADPDAALNAASELLAGMPGSLVIGAEPEIEVRSHIGGPSFIPGEGIHLGAVQPRTTGYERDGIGAPIGDVLAAFLHPGHGGMLADIPSGFGEITGPGNTEMAGSAASVSIAMPIQNSNQERNNRFPFVSETNSPVEKGQRIYVPDMPGLTMDQLDVEYGYPQLAQASESDQESESVLNASGHSDHWANLETSYGSLATNNALGKSNEADEFAPTGIAGNNSNKSDISASDTEGLFSNELSVFDHRSSGLLESDERAPYARIIDALERTFSMGQTRSDAEKETDTTDVGATITGLNRCFDQLTGVSAASTDRRETVDEDGIRQKLTLRLPDGIGKNVGEALRLQSDLSTLLPSNKSPDEKDITGVAGMWEMVPNLERFLPKQSTPSGRSAEVAAVGLSEGPEASPPGLLGQLLVRDAANDIDPEPMDMRATRISPVGGRGGPSGHKNDPIYMVAINQASGTLMPTVATAGSSTRSPAIPGQRNLP
jgi:hypothetical protein